MTTKGLDLSHWNRIYNYDAIGRQADFVILKCTEGPSWVDNTFEPRFKQFKKRGDVVLGAYHWLWKQDAREQARHFIRTVKKANGGTLDGVIMCVDVETTTFDGSKSAKFYSLEEFYEEFYRLTNMTLVVYTSPGYWNRMVRYAADNGDPKPHKDRIPNTVLWKAFWPGGPYSAKGRDLEDMPIPPRSSPVWAPMGGYQFNDIAMAQCLSLVKINGKPPAKGYDGNASYKSVTYLKSLTKEGRPDPDDGGEVITCPKGYHLDKASGNCVPNSDGGDQEPEEPVEPGDDTVKADTTTTGAMLAGFGGGSIIAAVVIGVAVFAVYAAVKGGGGITPVVDRGDKD